MNIVQINTYDVHGGAAKAAYRLLKGLRELNARPKMIVLHNKTNDIDVVKVDADNIVEKKNEMFYLSKVVQEQYINAHRTDISNTFFSLSYPGYDLSNLSYVRQADIINLHWIAFYQSPLTLHRLFTLDKPVVWTLHDMLPFTGGCHYSAGCDKYETGCHNCPQLAEDAFGLTSTILRDKQILFSGANLTIVTPSRWLADCARRSMLFQKCRIEVIPNSLETDIFNPKVKTAAKQRLELDTNSTYLLFVAEANYEKRKGFAELLNALRHCLAVDELRNVITSRNVKILCIGYPNNDLIELGIPIRCLGYIESEEQIVTAYSAADLFVLPSLEDNLPNTMLEAMSCGTPIVAFDVGGIPDVVESSVVGMLVPEGDIVQLANAIVALISDNMLRSNMEKNCRKLMVQKYSLEVQARSYFSLFSELIQRNNSLKSKLIKDEWTDMSPDENINAAAMIETELGDNFNSIYNEVLFKSLKEYAPIIQQKYDWCEMDMQLIKEQIKTTNADKKHSRLYNLLKCIWGQHQC